MATGTRCKSRRLELRDWGREEGPLAVADRAVPATGMLCRPHRSPNSLKSRRSCRFCCRQVTRTALLT